MFWIPTKKQVQNHFNHFRNRDCVKTRLDFRKLLVLCTKSWTLDVLHTYKAQFLESNLTFHTVSTTMRALPQPVFSEFVWRRLISPYWAGNIYVRKTQLLSIGLGLSYRK